MAKEFKLRKNQEFTFRQATGGGGAVSKYPWDEWFAPAEDKDGKQLHADGSGKLLLLERSIGPEDAKGTIAAPTEKRDFEVSVNSMVPKIKAAGRKRYKVVQVSRLDADGAKLKDALIIRARDMTADERLAEDLMRAEEKARRDEAGEPADAGEDDTPTRTFDKSVPMQQATA